ncbi:pyrimidine 5'-nucleotidase [Marinomonas sp. A79]|uniref:Pyrimidine 5'-nucleotidase n=1 Tax=Marinomonas vulgaris TaxID=2823372 RepID=A0ABS5HA00_9GAMM|nr:pyrimidine 5'-nucleotidase [Marinomonas vulgaris]MBR7888415.1 pyrimidine 5'-nucleotidase [Marinomonas vulgaris]
MKYQWILFDADETLFSFDNFSGLRHMFATHGVSFEQQDFDEYQSLNKPLWVEYQNGTISAEQLQTRRFQQWSDRLNIATHTLNTQFLNAMADICEPLAGARELVAYLHQNNVRMGIITNGFKQLQHIRLEKTGFLPYFSPVIISELVGVAKPHPRIFEQALIEMGNPEKHQVLMVGDTLESDVLGGNRIGLDTCWLNHHNKLLPENTLTENKAPTFQVSSLKQLHDVLIQN